MTVKNQTQEYLTTKQACEYLKCTEKTLRKIMKSGQLKFFKLNYKKVLIDQAELDAYIRNKSANFKEAGGNSIKVGSVDKGGNNTNAEQ